MPSFITDRAIGSTGRAFSRAVARSAVAPPAVPAATDDRSHLALREADRILAQQTREDVTPEMEPLSPSLTDEEPGEDFDENEDVTPDMEPFDPTIESSLKAIVSGDEDEVTITAEEGETIVAVTDDNGEIDVQIEDTADVLLGFDARAPKAIVSGDEDEVTITAEEGEVLVVDEADGAVIVEVDAT